MNKTGFRPIRSDSLPKGEGRKGGGAGKMSAGEGREGEEEPVAEDVKEGNGNEDAGRGPEVVHGPEKAKVAASVLVRGDVGDQGGARGAPDLAGPVEGAGGD